MSAETATANEEALTLLDLQPSDRVLEVGFGHGRTIERAATVLATGFIAGIDLSEEMVRMAERRCRRLIRDGKVTLSVGDSDHLPFPDQHFDKALSVHTVYFWADPVAHLREIRRVLADGGATARAIVAIRPAQIAHRAPCVERPGVPERDVHVRVAPAGRAADAPR